MATALTLALLFVGIFIFLASLDDLFVDILVLLRLRGRRIKKIDCSEFLAQQKPKIKVFVANWQEANVLREMVDGNLENFSYGPVKFVLGVYPNDVETRRVAESLAQSHPRSVEVVVNTRTGPTSKGQMLNEMFSRVFENPECAPDLVVLHDSEDVIAPLSFDIYASQARDHAMIQLPVLSLDSRARSIVGASYMEEFAERHTREMVVRNSLGAFVPSAGVGTCLRQDLILHFLNMRGYVLQPGSVTEDYILGAEAHREGFKTTFIALRDQAAADNPLIATLEYFPQDFWASTKQRGRWLYGISFDGTKRLGWSGSRWDRFFLYRDRKGAIANLLPFISLILLILCLLIGVDEEQLSLTQKRLLWSVLTINTFSIGVRLYFKAAALREIYGSHDLFGLILRWPVVTTINAFATARAWRSFILESGWGSRPIAWAKTRHEIPAAFGFLNGIGATPLVELARSQEILGRRAFFSRHNIMHAASVACLALALILAGDYWYQKQNESNTKYEYADTLEKIALHQPAPIETAAFADDGAKLSQDESRDVREHAVAAIKRSADKDKAVLEKIAHRQLVPIETAAFVEDGAKLPQDESRDTREHAVAAIKRSADKDKAVLEKIAYRQRAPIEIAAFADDGAKLPQDESRDIREHAVAAIKWSTDKDKAVLEKIAYRQPVPMETSAGQEKGGKNLRADAARGSGSANSTARKSYKPSGSAKRITKSYRATERRTAKRNRRYKTARARFKAKRGPRRSKRRKSSYARAVRSTSFLRRPSRAGRY